MTTAVYNATPQTVADGDDMKLQCDANGNLKIAGTVTATASGTQAISAPIGGTYTDRSIANLSGASETLMAANANRRVLVVHNIGATAVAINLTGGTASLTAGGSVGLIAAASLVLDTYPPTSAITIIGTLNADVTAYEG